MANIKYSYKTVTKRIGQTDLDNGSMEQLENRRRLRMGTVREIYEQLCNKQHFDSKLCVNKRNGVHRLIDGNHRWEALKRYLKEHPNDTVDIEISEYNNLTDEEEKEVYAKVNKGNKQNTNDVVKQYEDELKVFNTFKKGWQSGGGVHTQFPVPVTAYPTPQSITFYRIVGSYLAAVKAKNWNGGYMGTPWDFIEECKKLTVEDVKVMAAFTSDFLQAFGPVKGNTWLKSTPFTALMKIWYDNRNISQPVMIKFLKTKIANDKICKDSSSQGGAGATVSAHMHYLKVLNAGRQRAQFQ